MKKFNPIKTFLAFILLILLCTNADVKAQSRKVFFVTNGNNVTSTGATFDSSLIDSLKKYYDVRVWTYKAALKADTSLSLDSAGVIVVSRSISSGFMINTSTTADWWASRPVPIIYLCVQAVSNNRSKLINAGSSVTKSWTNNGRIRPRDLVIKAYVKDQTDPAFQGVAINDGKVDFYNWIYETINMDSATFVNPVTGQYGKLLATVYDPDTVSTNKKVIMARWNPGDSTYRGTIANPSVKVANYRSYIQFGTDQSSFRHFNDYQSQSIQLLVNEIKYVCPNVLTAAPQYREAKKENARIYPNPVLDNLTIEMDKISTASNISIYKVNGTKVLSFRPAGKHEVINLSALKAGIYLVKITTDRGVTVKSIIKK